MLRERRLQKGRKIKKMVPLRSSTVPHFLQDIGPTNYLKLTRGDVGHPWYTRKWTKTHSKWKCLKFYQGSHQFGLRKQNHKNASFAQFSMPGVFSSKSTAARDLWSCLSCLFRKIEAYPSAPGHPIPRMLLSWKGPDSRQHGLRRQQSSRSIG